MRSTVLTLTCLLLASGAAAQDFRFQYSPEDLMSPAELYSRLDEAAFEHCRNINDIRNPRIVQACRKQLMELAVEEISHPALTAYLETGRTQTRS